MVWLKFVEKLQYNKERQFRNKRKKKSILTISDKMIIFAYSSPLANELENTSKQPKKKREKNKYNKGAKKQKRKRN